MMDGNKTAVERAFELASSGQVTSVAELRRALADDGYSATQVVGPHLMRQLRLLMRASRDNREEPG
jgi:hypothetical protein